MQKTFNKYEFLFCCFIISDIYNFTNMLIVSLSPKEKETSETGWSRFMKFRVLPEGQKVRGMPIEQYLNMCFLGTGNLYDAVLNTTKVTKDMQCRPCSQTA